MLMTFGGRVKKLKSMFRVGESIVCKVFRGSETMKSPNKNQAETRLRPGWAPFSLFMILWCPMGSQGDPQGIGRGVGMEQVEHKLNPFQNRFKTAPKPS